MVRSFGDQSRVWACRGKAADRTNTTDRTVEADETDRTDKADRASDANDRLACPDRPDRHESPDRPVRRFTISVDSPTQKESAASVPGAPRAALPRFATRREARRSRPSAGVLEQSCGGRRGRRGGPRLVRRGGGATAR